MPDEIGRREWIVGLQSLSGARLNELRQFARARADQRRPLRRNLMPERIALTCVEAGSDEPIDLNGDERERHEQRAEEGDLELDDEDAEQMSRDQRHILVRPPFEWKQEIVEDGRPIAPPALAQDLPKAIER